MKEKGKFVISSKKRRRRRDEYDDASSKSNKRRRRIRRVRRRRRREVTEIPNEDLLEEIMLRLPVKTLIRFQSVSKQWKRVITSKYLSERYLLYEKTKEIKFLCPCEVGYSDALTKVLKTVHLDWSFTCLVEEEKVKYNLRVDDDREVGIVSNSLDGLVCFHGSSMDSSKRIKVVNQATRWSYKIPRAEVQRTCNYGKNHSPSLRLGKDYATGIYKLVWLYYRFKNMLSCEVFDFGIKQWRYVDSTPLVDHGLKKNQVPSVVNGRMYWLHRDKTKLIAFDLHMEVFKVIPNPIIEESSLICSKKTKMRMDSVDGHHFVWFSLTTNGDGMQHVWKLTNHNTRGELSIVDKIFSFNYRKITSKISFRLDDLVPTLFSIKPISKNANKFLLSRRNHNHHHHHFLLVQTLNSTSFCIFPFSSPLPFPGLTTALIPFFPSVIFPF